MLVKSGSGLKRIMLLLCLVSTMPLVRAVPMRAGLDWEAEEKEQ